MDPADRDALLTLSLTPGLGPTLTRRCLAAFGSPGAVLHASARDLAGVEGIGPQRAGAIRAAMDGLSDGQALAREKELIARHGVNLLAEGDPDYPALLRHIPDPPPLLYVRGWIEKSDALALGIVGARKCTGYGREQADRLAALCAQAGLCIVSGGAYGIDAAAHRAALRAGGRTIAVLGSGLANPYPADHVPLFDQIAGNGTGGERVESREERVEQSDRGAETERGCPQPLLSAATMRAGTPALQEGAQSGGGAVVSELPMSAPPVPENFPRRNRIISGLSLGVLVVEASLRSGALITARLCSEEHNREVMALPGRVDSQASAGCHKMIREGWATLVTSAADVLDALGETGSLLKAGLSAETNPKEETSGGGASLFERNLTGSQRKVVDALTELRTLDQLAAITGLPVSTLQADLTMLQIRGLVAKEAGGYRRKR